MGGESTKVFAKGYLCGPERSRQSVRKDLEEANPGFMVQTARSRSAMNEFYLELLAAQTLQAESSGCLLAKRPEIDFLLRLARTTQISVAIKKEGVRDGEGFVAVAAGLKEVRTPKSLSGLGLSRRGLSKEDARRVEQAALLNARRA